MRVHYPFRVNRAQAVASVDRSGLSTPPGLVQQIYTYPCTFFGFGPFYGMI